MFMLRLKLETTLKNGHVSLTSLDWSFALMRSRSFGLLFACPKALGGDMPVVVQECIQPVCPSASKQTSCALGAPRGLKTRRFRRDAAMNTKGLCPFSWQT